jgi:peptidoglycan/LPS O-acetylase OafA/YrhL
MRICVNCGIELDDGLRICPLCGKDPENKGEQEHIPENYPSDIIQLQKKENKRYLSELSGIIAFSGIAVCTIVDLLISKGLRWSLFSDVSIAAVWIILSLFLFAYKRPLILAAFLMLTVLAALFFIDLIAAGQEWFFPVGIPVTITAFIAAGVIIILYRAAHFKGLNIIAAALIILSGFCIITEMILDEYLNGFVDLRWSLIAAISTLPVALVFFFYHYRLKKGNRLNSFFHI